MMLTVVKMKLLVLMSASEVCAFLLLSVQQLTVLGKLGCT